MKRLTISLALSLCWSVSANAACDQSIDGFRFCAKNWSANGAPVEISILNGKALTYGLLPADSLYQLNTLSYFSKDEFFPKLKLGFVDTSIVDSRNGLVQKVLDNVTTKFMTETVIGVADVDDALGTAVSGNQPYSKDFTLYTDMTFSPLSMPTVMNYANIATIVFDMKAGKKSVSGNNTFANLYNKLAVTEANKEKWKGYCSGADAILGLVELGSILFPDEDEMFEWIGNAHAVVDKAEGFIEVLPTQSAVTHPRLADTVTDAVLESVKEQSPMLALLLQAAIDFRKSGASLTSKETFYKAIAETFYEYLVTIDVSIKTKYVKAEFADHVTRFLLSRNVKAKATVTVTRYDIVYFQEMSKTVLNSPAIKAAFKSAFSKKGVADMIVMVTGPINQINSVMSSLGDEQTYAQLLQFFATEYFVGHFTSGSVDFLKNMTTSVLKTAVPGYRVASAANDLGAVGVDALTAPKYVPFTLAYAPATKTSSDHGLTFSLPKSVDLSLRSYIEDVTDEEIAPASAGYRHKVKDILLDQDAALFECFDGWGCRYEVSSRPSLMMKPGPVFYQQFYLGAEGMSTGTFSSTLLRNPKIRVGLKVDSEIHGDLISPHNLPMEEIDAGKFVVNQTLQGRQYAAIDFKTMFKDAQNSWLHSLLSGENRTYLKLTTGNDVYNLHAIVDFNDPPGGRQTVNAVGIKGSTFVSSQQVYIAQGLGGVRPYLAPKLYYAPAPRNAVRIAIDNQTSHTVHYYLYDEVRGLSERLLPADGSMQGVLPKTTASLYPQQSAEWVANQRIAGKIVTVGNNVARYLNAMYGGNDVLVAAAIKRMLVEQGANEYVVTYDGASLTYEEGTVPVIEKLSDLASLDSVASEPSTDASMLEIQVADKTLAASDVNTAQFTAKSGEVITLHARNTPDYPSFSALTGPIWVVLRQSAGGACPAFGGLKSSAEYCTVAATVTADGGITFTMPAFEGENGRFSLAAISERNADGSANTLIPPWAIVRVVEVETTTSGTGTGSTAPASHPLNDTGIVGFSDDSQNVLSSEPATHPGQDARFGRDAQAGAGKLTKIGGGSKGFDFTKIANDGSVLPESAVLGSGATDWACTRDNVTGLIWEVKTTAGLRSQDYSYTWYDSNSASNGGSAGTASGGSCATAERCDTEKFVQDVNAASLCGASDWRMPKVNELFSIVDHGVSYPTIDTTWFPNTPASNFWLASAYAGSSGYAWYVVFGYGYTDLNKKSNTYQARLVRAGQ